jgi:hypothetical protein
VHAVTQVLLPGQTTWVPGHSHWQLVGFWTRPPLQVTCGQTHTPELQAVLGAVQVETHLFCAGSQTSHFVASHAVAKQVSPQTLVSGQQAPAIHFSMPTQVETHLPVPGSQTSHFVASHAVAKQVPKWPLPFASMRFR